MKTGQFAAYLQEKVFPHIPLTTFFGMRAGFMKNFYRSSLAKGNWKNMTACDKDKYLG